MVDRPPGFSVSEQAAFGTGTSVVGPDLRPSAAPDRVKGARRFAPRVLTDPCGTLDTVSARGAGSGRKTDDQGDADATPSARPKRNLCRLSAGDMTCPHEQSLDVFLEELLASGYQPHYDEIDARFARSGLVRCSNCGGAGCFDYRGLRRGRSLRAFWSCRRCGHWIEV